MHLLYSVVDPRFVIQHILNSCSPLWDNKVLFTVLYQTNMLFDSVASLHLLPNSNTKTDEYNVRVLYRSACQWFTVCYKNFRALLIRLGSIRRPFCLLLTRAGLVHGSWHDCIA